MNKKNKNKNKKKTKCRRKKRTNKQKKQKRRGKKTKTAHTQAGVGGDNNIVRERRNTGSAKPHRQRPRDVRVRRAGAQPWRTHTQARAHAPAHGVRARQGDNAAVVKAHAVEDVAQVVGGVRIASIRVGQAA